MHSFSATADWLVWLFINFWVRYGFLNSVNRAAKHYGVQGYDSIFDYWRGDITLVAEPAEFSGVNLPAKHLFIGPLIPQDEFPMPHELADVPRDKPLIYFAMGSSGTPGIVARIVESFEGKEYRVIAPVKFQLAELPRVHIPSERFRHRLGSGPPGQRNGRSGGHSRWNWDRDDGGAGRQAGRRRWHADGTGRKSGLSGEAGVRDSSPKVTEPVPKGSGSDSEAAGRQRCQREGRCLCRSHRAMGRAQAGG